MKNRVWTGMLTLAVSLAGCQGNPFASSPHLDEAKQEWFRTRAQVLCKVGAEHLRVGQLDRARNKAQEALTLDNDYVEARILLAKVLIEQGHHERALAELGMLEKEHPQRNDVIFLKAIALEQSGQFEQALAAYDRAYAMNTRNLSAARAAVEVLVAMDKVPEARRRIESYLAEDGDDPSLFETAGRLAMMEQDYPNAVKHYQGAVDRDFKNGPYRAELARAQFFAGTYEDGAENLRRLQDRPEYAKTPWVATLLGDCYMALNRPRQARDAYQIAMDTRPNDPGVWVNLSKASLALGDLARANLSARKALDLDPKRMDAVLVASYALIRRGELKEAYALLAPAYKQNPDNGMLLCLLGQMYSAAGDREQAARCYAAAAQVDPESRLARQLIGPAPAAKTAAAGAK